jgi:two-component system, OmpR family, sensor histidine kinase KdpD
MDIRPDPDALLAAVKAEESEQARGRLKIFLGYAAGVGKTYAMLEAAHQRLTEGVDVVIGLVETHKRPETESLVRGLPLIPRKRIEYRGTVLEEMDLDAVLARRPQLVLVDEFAHTNAPGSRHAKRYQDVQELLAAGIDVYTTLNIQHLESLNDAVAQITGVTVRETIPDTLLDEANEIEVIDLPPAELLQRLREGKVYVPDQVVRAIERFFREGNLTALREMALRRAAERVDDQMLDYMQTRAIPGPWPAHERLMVLLGSSPLSERLIRAARRLADELNAEWFAVHVDTPGAARGSPGEREGTAEALRLAEELGAKAVTLPGRWAAETAVAYARQHNITKILVGKPLRSRWQELLHGSTVDQLLRQGGPIDVYVISGTAQTPPPFRAPSWRPHRPFRRYLLSAGMVLAATLLGFLLDPALSLEKWNLFVGMLDRGVRVPMHSTGPAIEPTNLVMLYLMVVVIAALRWGRGPAILASVLSVVAFDFFFIVPYLTFAVSDTQYVLTFTAFLIVGLVMSTLTARAREQADLALRRQLETAELYDLSRDLTSAADLDTILQVLLRHVESSFGRGAAVILPGNSPDDRVRLAAAGSSIQVDDNEVAVADWVFRHGQPAGRNTDTLPAARLHYLPLKTARGTVGVLGVGGPESEGHYLGTDQQRLMEAFASQASLAIERSLLEQAARRAHVLEATDRLQTALLNSISHDLRTPLVSITGALSSLQQDEHQLDPVNRRSLIDNALTEAERLNRLVGNLLSMTRLESGAMRVSQEPCDLQDIIGAAIRQMEEPLADRKVGVEIPEGLPLVPMDFVLIVQVLVNLLDNAVKYSAPGTPIEVRARQSGDTVELEVADRGVGIPTEDLDRVFDKFYRVQRPENVGGTGLGLSICKGIVEAHGGRIQARPRQGGGTIVMVTLPMK